jgi:hypothetical protein
LPANLVVHPKPLSFSAIIAAARVEETRNWGDKPNNQALAAIASAMATVRRAISA